MGILKDLEKQPHLLIGGATGSGKSVLENTLICDLLNHNPSARFILIDPKRVELSQYKQLDVVFKYASEKDDIYNTLIYAVELMEKVYNLMEQNSYKQSPWEHVYIIIDEFADLMTTDKKRCMPLIQRIAQLGRAANFHLIICTQRPTNEILPGVIKVNIDSRIALRCPTAQDSRNLIRVSGAEKLPRYGKGLYTSPDIIGEPMEIDIPYITDEEQKEIISRMPKKQKPKIVMPEEPTYSVPEEQKKSLWHRFWFG